MEWLYIQRNIHREEIYTQKEYTHGGTHKEDIHMEETYIEKDI